MSIQPNRPSSFRLVAFRCSIAPRHQDILLHKFIINLLSINDSVLLGYSVAADTDAPKIRRNLHSITSQLGSAIPIDREVIFLAREKIRRNFPLHCVRRKCRLPRREVKKLITSTRDSSRRASRVSPSRPCNFIERPAFYSRHYTYR